MYEEVVAPCEQTNVKALGPGLKNVLDDEPFNLIGFDGDLLERVGDQIDRDEVITLAGATKPDEQPKFLKNRVEPFGMPTEFYRVLKIQTLQEVGIRGAQHPMFEDPKPIGVAPKTAGKEGGVILSGKCPHGNILRIDPQPRIIVGIKQAEVRSLLIELV